MKKKGIFAFLLCFVMLFFVGCGDGGPSGGGGGGDNPGIENPDEGNEDFEEDYNLLEMDGAKVLSKPSDYSFKNAVGNFSVNYYNLFASEIFMALYEVYENENVQNDAVTGGTTKRDMIYAGLNKEEGFTYSAEYGEDEDNVYYLYDTLRYTISNIETVYDAYGDFESQTITLDYDTIWNWTLSPSSTLEKKGTVFNNVNNNALLEVQNDGTITFKSLFLNTLGGWKAIYQGNMEKLYAPSFGEFYSGEENFSDVEGERVTNYWTSPYYEKVVEGKPENELTAQNYFQDALEYAIYLFVLGYDYVDDKGAALSTEQPTEGRLFDFAVKADVNTGAIVDVTVKGWSTSNNDVDLNNAGEISIVDALAKVKAQYEENGGYVGVTKTNKAQIVRFIKDKVIGKAAFDKNLFSIQTSDVLVERRPYAAGDVASTTETKDADGNKVVTKIEIADGFTTKTQTTFKELKFNRNYDAIINNIVEYACTKAPIGLMDGKPLTLGDAYLASTITDYVGNYFMCSYTNNEDDNLFEFIPSAEYQSIVIYPHKDNIGKSIGDLWLAFEYWDDPNDIITPATNKRKDTDGIVINVGFRYFNSATGECTDFFSTVELAYGKFSVYYFEDGTVNDDFEEQYTSHILTIGDNDESFDYNIVIGDVPMKAEFEKNIGDGAINPFAFSTHLAEVGQITIKGNTKAKDFYMLNDSASGHGVFGTLNPDKFAGEGGCDYIEVYFDVLKSKGKLGVDYSFKVGVSSFLASDVDED